jgi:hypothetical protein
MDEKPFGVHRVIAGLQILAKYSDSVDAQHDVIYAGPGDSSVISREDAAELERIGWHYESDVDSWAVFT